MAIYTGGDSPDVFIGGPEGDDGSGGGGDDQLSGNGGNDVLAGGSGSDILDGGADNDDLYSAARSNSFGNPWWDNPYTAPSLDSGAEADSLQGGDGDDRLFAGHGDTVDGGSGSRDLLFISFLGASSGVTVDFHLPAQVVGGGTIANVEGVAWVEGSDHDDEIDVGFVAENFLGWGAVFGMGGKDRLLAGYYTVLLDGGSGDDVLDGRTGSYHLQTLEGGEGDDILYSGSLTRSRGGDGNDTIYSTGMTSGGAGDDIIVLVTGYSGAQVNGDSGDDDITGSSSWSNYISGGEGADIVRGGEGGDNLASGDFGVSSFTGVDSGLEQDVIEAGDGNDIVSIGYGDHADGGSGTDNLWLSLAGHNMGLFLDTNLILSGAPVQIGGGVIAGFETIEYIQGTSSYDTIVVATQSIAMLLIAGDGNDYITGAGSRIDLYGGNGDDHYNSGTAPSLFNGGAGSDTVSYRSAAAGITVSLGYDGNFAPQSPGDTLVYVENVIGTAFADTLTGNEQDNRFEGLDGDDILTGNEGNDHLEGGAGIDTMRGGAGDDSYWVDDAGDVVEELAGGGIDRVHVSLAAYSLIGTQIERLAAASHIAHDFRGNSGNNVLTGGDGGDILRVYDGGNDQVYANGGNDIIFMGRTLDVLDVVHGGAGVDTLVLWGGHVGLTLSASVGAIENISLLSGSNTSFGEPGTERHDWVITTRDQNFDEIAQARINGAALLAGEDFTFDGSAETNVGFVVYGGKGVDNLTGGLGNDIFFYAEERFASGDKVNGGWGYDGMFLRGNYTIDFNSPGYTGLFTGIENLTLTSATDERYARGGGTEFDYDITLSDAIVGAGAQLTVSGALLLATETMILDASAETDGILRLFGGAARDTLKGGANADLIHGNLGADLLWGGGGADMFRFDKLAESSNSSVDQIFDFTPGTDKIDLSRIDANSLVEGNQAFTWVTHGQSGMAGTLSARAFTGGAWLIEGHTDGDGQIDLLILVVPQGPAPIGAGDFLL